MTIRCGGALTRHLATSVCSWSSSGYTRTRTPRSVGGYGRIVAMCRVGGADLNAWWSSWGGRWRIGSVRAATCPRRPQRGRSAARCGEGERVAPVTLAARRAALRRSSERFRRVLRPPGTGELVIRV